MGASKGQQSRRWQAWVCCGMGTLWEGAIVMYSCSFCASLEGAEGAYRSRRFPVSSHSRVKRRRAISRHPAAQDIMAWLSCKSFV